MSFICRSVYGNSVGPRQVVPTNSAGNAETNTSKLFVYEGLQVRAKPLNVTVTPSTLTQPARTPSSPILKAQLSSPSTPNISKKEVKSKVRNFEKRNNLPSLIFFLYSVDGYYLDYN